jgi:hypothetical protein
MNLAPNGKPSNLTDEQYKIVRTPAFKKWFGDWENDIGNSSKVVDENGEPLVFYHETKNNFNIFEEGKNTVGTFGRGSYFANSKEYASDYNRGANQKILSLFLNITNPIKIKDEIMPYGYQNFSVDKMNDNKGYSRGFTIKAKAENYNGVIAELKYGDIEFVAFNPNQIKLADGTNTTFDANNQDIRYEEGGATKTYKNKFNIKYGFDKNESHSLAEISKLSKLKLSSLQDIYNKGIGAYKTNPQSVRPNVKSKEQWAMARVYSAIMGGKAAKVDANELSKGKMKTGGNVNEFVIGKTYTGKEVKGIVSKYGSREGTDMNEFADEEINEDDKYILENVEISNLLQRDVNLKDYIKDELENYKKGNKITEPILLGNDPFSMEKNVVRDGFGRTTQTIANGEKTILAFVKTSNKYKTGGATTAFTYTIGGL